MKKEGGKASLDHLNLTVRNFEETVAWYGGIFGFELVEKGIEDDGPWGILKNGDSMLCIYENRNRVAINSDPSAERFHQIYHFGLRISDPTSWENALKSEALRTHYGSPIRYPHSTSWYVTDPTGYMIEVALWDNDLVRFDERSPTQK